jgi:Family of unknown function (DUF5906)
MVLSASPSGGNQPPENKLFSITIFPNNLARKKQEKTLTLAGLETLILQTHAASKDRLPLVKMALFGDVPSTKNCLRHDTNMLDITGIEVEHDSGQISFKRAIKILTAARLCCLIYTTPSHKPVDNERWRVLLPLSKALPNSERRHLVELVNGLFEGGLAPESFRLSQAFYFGAVEGAALHIKRLDGVFVDLAGLTKAIGPAPGAGKGTNRPATIAAGHTLADLQAMKQEYLRRREGWHNMMLTITSSLVARQFSDNEIQEFCAAVCDRGRDDPEMLDMLTSARAKFGHKPIPAALKAILQPNKPASTTVTREEKDAPAEPADGAPLADKIGWLLGCYGHDPKASRVVELHEPTHNCLIKMTDFRDAFAHWYEVQFGPFGGQKKVTAAAGWLTSKRLMIAGVRMAPDRDFPVYQEDGNWFKNTYRKPRHAAGSCDVAPFLRFLARLIPDQASFDYQLDWMAYKLRHPETPGCAILHVADNDLDTKGAREGSYGTGRGLLFSILRALYGTQYCGEQDFRTLVGSGGQADFTDWLHNRVLVTCDEARSSPTFYRRGEREVAYEALKRAIDPAITERTFTAKYLQAFKGRCHASILIATNHSDALAIPAKDRRISVVRNGRLPTKQEIADIVAWRGQAGALAALEAHLMARDLSAFDAYEPLQSAARDDMIEASIGEVEEIVMEIAADDSLGLVFLRDDLFNAVRAQYNQGDTIAGHFNDAWRRHTTKALSADGTQRRVRIGNRQPKLYCFRRMADQVMSLTAEEARAEALRWRPGLTVLPGLGTR